MVGVNTVGSKIGQFYEYSEEGILYRAGVSIIVVV